MNATRALNPFDQDEEKTEKIRWRLARDSAIIRSAVRSKKLYTIFLVSLLVPHFRA